MATQEELAAAFQKVENATLNVSYTPVSTYDSSVIHKTTMDGMASIFDMLTGANEIPYSHFPSDEWYAFISSQCAPSAVVVLLGFFVCIWLLVNLTCVKDQYHHGDNEELEKSLRHGRSHLRCTSCCGFLLLWCVAGWSYGSGAYAFDIIYRQVEELEPEVDLISNKVAILQRESLNSAVWMRNFTSSCVGWSTVAPALGQNITGMLSKLEVAIANVSETLYTIDLTTHNLPDIIAEGRTVAYNLSHHWKHMMMGIVFAPTILATLVILLILCVVERETQHPGIYKTVNFLIFELGAAPMTCFVLLITLVSAVVLVACVVLGTFCGNASQNVVNLVSATKGAGNRTGNITNVVDYYLTGSPDHNFINEGLTTVQNVMTPLSAAQWAIIPAINVLGLFCNRVQNALLPDLLSTAVPTVKMALPFVRRDSVYRHYDQIVHQGVCGQLSFSMGWYFATQFIAGLILLPCIAVKSHRYISELSELNKRIEKKFKKEFEKEEERLLEYEEKWEKKEVKGRTHGFNCCSRGAELA